MLARSDGIVAGVLFSVSAVLTALLFYELAGVSWLYRVIFTLLAVTFDATKVVLWIRGTREGNVVFMAIAMALVGVSLLASAGSALMIVSAGDGKDGIDDGRISGARRALEGAEKELAGWQDRLDLVPADFTSQLKMVAAALEDAREERDLRQRELDVLTGAAEQGRSSSGSMFRLLSEWLGLPVGGMRFMFLLAMGVLLEAGALATSWKPPARARAAAMAVMCDTFGVAHVLKGGRALCGKPAPWSPVTNGSRSCTLCMRRSVDAQA